ncbi:transketolase C-terminal domain-containing protein [Thermogladius sp. 4427co]|uniref:transketolase C-terminal domain-containing protein n=1 Tax=Thermogladius sp. 4427co TaxID=3450718 RepID=UPI003F79E37E
MTVNGDEAVAYAVKQSLVDVVAAYPITPQTIIVEKFSEFVADGEVKTEFIPVESEHSAMSACVGAAAAGARAFTATSSQGLAFMVEILYIASALRLPIVMAVVNRALSAPINIHNDHSDAYLMRDSGWIQLFVENVQEAYDTTIQAFRIAEDERVLLPVAVNLDGFFLSHTLENIYMLPDEAVHEFLGGYRKVSKVKVAYFDEEVPLMLNPARPLSFGNLDLYDYYFEHKVQQVEAMKTVPEVVREVNEEWFKLTGRRYGDGVMETFGVEDADIIIVAMGSGAGTVRSIVKKMRKEGYSVGMVKLRMFRPFPFNDIAEKLKNARLVAVMDKGISPGSYGPLFLEINTALYDYEKRPMLVNYIYGLGGRDLVPALVEDMIKELASELEKGLKEPRLRYLGVRE